MTPTNTNPYSGLRNQVLALQPAKVGLSSEQPAQVLAGLMEMAVKGGVASLVVIADGTTSMYWSTGGGIIGAGFHEAVKPRSKAFLTALQRHLHDLGADEPSHPLPSEGMVHFRVLTFGGDHLLAAAPDKALKDKQHPLWEAFYAGHAVITVIRQLPPAGDAKPRA